MRKFWFAIIDIVLMMTISCADSDGEQLHDDENTTDSYNRSDDDSKDVIVGDMLLTRDQVNYLYSTDSSQRLGLANPIRQWPNASVFYKFDKSLDQKAKGKVIVSMNYIQNVSCIRFIEKDEKTRNYVLIKQGKACNSKIGMQQGQQPMIIDGYLCTKGNVVHEILHTLGFLHMHTANIRDEYININWDNIKDNAKLNFKPFLADVSMFDTPYDYNSITHYSSTAYAKNKSIPTIIAKIEAPNMGQRKALSVGDLTRLNRMYNCPNFEVPTIKPNGRSLREMEAQSSNGTEANKMVDSTPPNNLSMDVDGNEKKISDLNSTNSNTNALNYEDDEDDMILSQEQLDELYSTKATKRTGLKSDFFRWPEGVVPFQINASYSPEFISSIYDSMNYISNHSCIRFVERASANNQNYIYITSTKSGCSSEVGMRHTGRQLMNINEQHCPRGKIIHELLHALGFLHMHTANERDNYIQINWNNIKPDAWTNFKQFVSHVSMFSTPYDYNSILHYSTKAFAVDRSKDTIIPLRSAPDMGQRKGMSQGDIIRLNRMYKCNMTTTVFSDTSIKSLSSKITPIETSNTEVGGDSLKNSKTSPWTRERENEDKQARTILGVLIFKLVGKN
ncbi:hypothetical protein ACKWTF_009180 [Chironomus riparius]